MGIVALAASLALHLSVAALSLSFVERTKSATIIVGLETPPKGTGEEQQKAGKRIPPAETPRRLQRPEAKKSLPVPVRKEPVARQTEQRQMAKAPEAAKQVSPLESAAPGPAESGSDTRGQGHWDGNWKELNLYSAEDPEWSEYLGVVMERIKKRFRYPPEEITRGRSGALEIKFGIKRNGELEFVEIRRKSGSDVLDGNAIEAIRQAAPFPPLPQKNIPGINLDADFRYILRSAK